MVVHFSGCSGTAPISPPGSAGADEPIVRVLHAPIQGRGLPGSIDQIRFVGRNSAGLLLYGPDVRTAQPEIELEGVPIEVTVLELHYLTRGELEGYFAAGINLSAGSQLIDNPPWALLDELTGLEITPASVTVPAGTQTELDVVGDFQDGTRMLLTTIVAWSSQDSQIASASSDISQPGVVQGVSFGFTRAVASLRSHSAECAVTVNDTPLQSIRVEPVNSTISIGLTQQYQATAVFTDGREADVTSTVEWSSSAPEVGTIAPGGLLTGVSEGRAVVVAALGTVRGTTNLRVSDAALLSLAIQPQSSSPLGVTVQFQATGTFSDGSTRDVTNQVRWESSNPDGLLVAFGGLAQSFTVGTYTVTASLFGLNTSSQLTVTPATVVEIFVLAPPPGSAPAGREVQFTALGRFSDGTALEITQLVTWSTSDSNLATASNAPVPAGLVRGLLAGNVDVLATLNGVQGSAPFEVTAAVLDFIQVTPANGVLDYETATTRQMTATGVWTDGSQQDLTATALWNSSDPQTVGVDASGLATAVDRGRVLLSARSDGVTGNTELTVRSGTLTALAVEPGIDPLTAVGATRRFRAFGQFAGSSLSPTGEATDLVTWSTDDQAVATQSNSATTAGVATGVSEGNCLVTATDPVTGVNASRTLHVNYFLYLLGQAGELVGRDIDLIAQTSMPTPNFAYISTNPVKVQVDPTGRYLVLVDGGFIGIALIDPATGALAFTDVENVLAFSSAVRNLAFEPRGRWFYVTGDNDQLYHFSFNAVTGQAALVQNSGGFLVNTTGLAVHPNSRFVALANGAAQGVFQVNPDTGQFIQVTNFFNPGTQTNATWEFYPGETILYGDYAVTFIDPAIGGAAFLGFVISGGPQVSLAKIGLQRYLFSPNTSNRNVLAYLVGNPAVEPATLTPMPGSPYPTGGNNPASGGTPLATVVHPSQGTLFVVTNLDIEWHSISDRLSLILRDPLAISPAASAAGTP